MRIPLALHHILEHKRESLAIRQGFLQLKNVLFSAPDGFFNNSKANL
jgi:hypothetical protein